MKTINDLIKQRLNPLDLTDEQVLGLSYGIKYFGMGPGEFNQDEVAYWQATRPVLEERLLALESGQTTSIEDLATTDQNHRVQLWEPCEICGSEPSYSAENGHFCKQHLD